MTTNSSCSVCGTSTAGGDHPTEKECIAALRVALDQMVARVAQLEQHLALTRMREWAFREIIAHNAGASILKAEDAVRFKRWIAQERDPKILRKALTASSHRVRELAAKYAHPDAWDEDNLRIAMAKFLAILAERRLLPKEWATEERLRRWIVPFPTHYGRGAYEDWMVGKPLGALARNGYTVPEKLRREAARLAGRKFRPYDLKRRIHLASNLLDIPELSIGNLRNIAKAFLDVEHQREPTDRGLSTEPVYKGILDHPSCTKQLALMLLEKGRDIVFVLRALAAHEEWRKIPKIQEVLLESTDARVLWPLCCDAKISRSEFARLLEKAIHDDPVYVLQQLEKQRPHHLRASDLMPFLNHKNKEIRLKAIAIIGGLEEAATQEMGSIDRLSPPTRKNLWRQMAR